MTDFITDTQRQRAVELQKELEDIYQGGREDMASELESENENENENEVEANAVVHNHYHESCKKGHDPMYHSYPVAPVMPMYGGGYGGGCHDNSCSWLGMMFPFMMMGMWNRGGWGNGDGFNHGGCGCGGRGCSCCGVEGRLHNDLAIQTLNNEVHANALANCNATSQIMANDTSNSRYLGDALFSGFASLKSGQCELGKEVAAAGWAITRANDQNTFGLSRQLDANAAAAAACCCQTQREIDHATFALSRQLDQESARSAACCCETNLNIERQGHANTLSNCQQTNLLTMQHAELMNAIKEVGCQVVNTSKDECLARQSDEIMQLRAQLASGHTIGAIEAVKDHLAKQIGCCCCQTGQAINQLGSNQHITNPTTTQWPPMTAFSCCGC